MKAVGIVCEYDPFHNGHRFQIEESRRLTGADVVVCAMSGDFVQRGMPAVMDKWTRAETAIAGGADVVIEIPVRGCLGSASVYAVSAVRLLESFSELTHISFGSETGDTERLELVAERMLSGDVRCRASGIARSDGCSYPAAVEKAYKQIYGSGSDSGADMLRNPNDILAMEYITAMRRAEPVAVRRTGAMHGEGHSGTGFESGTAIRDALANGSDISGAVPEATAAALENAVPQDIMLNRLFDLARFSALRTDPELMDTCPHGGDGLGLRLRSCSPLASDLDDLIRRTKSKRYTYTRISRFVMQVTLGIFGRDETLPGYIRILGAGKKGRAFLRESAKNGRCSLPLITNINRLPDTLNDSDIDMIELEARAADIYSIICGRDMYAHSDHVVHPVML
jgi:predicted nucleotidyltransferase